MTSELAKTVAANVRAEAARRGLTQNELARRIGLAQSAVSDRYRERRQWQLEDLEVLAELFGIEPAELLARPKGFEPLTFWLGADHTFTVVEHVPGQRVWFCDGCGASGRAFDLHPGGLAVHHSLISHDRAMVAEANSGALLGG